MPFAKLYFFCVFLDYFYVIMSKIIFYKIKKNDLDVFLNEIVSKVTTVTLSYKHLLLIFWQFRGVFEFAFQSVFVKKTFNIYV